MARGFPFRCGWTFFFSFRTFDASHVSLALGEGIEKKQILQERA